MPGLQWQKRLRRTGGTRIHRFCSIFRSAVEEESEIDRKRQALPFAIRQIQFRQGTDISWDQLETTVKHSLKTKSARVTGANDLGIGHFQHVAVLGSETDAAKFTPLEGGSRLCEAAQGSEYGLVVSRHKMLIGKKPLLQILVHSPT